MQDFSYDHAVNESSSDMRDFAIMSSSDTCEIQSSGGNQDLQSFQNESSEEQTNDGVDGIIELGRYAQSHHATKKLRSRVWKDFKIALVEGCAKAVCVHCNSQLVTGNKNGTSHLSYHIRVCPELQKSKKKKTGTPKATLPVFDQQRSREDFVRMVVCHNYSFCMCEHYYTRQFVYNLQPQFKLMHRTAVKEDVIRLYKEERGKLYEILDKNLSRISITSDMWTSTEMTAYMSMTAHYIDADRKLHKKIIGLVHVKTPHTGVAIAKAIMTRLYEWNLDRKLFSFVLDNCSVNDVVVREVLVVLVPKKALHLNGDFFHIRCAAHILNLIVQDGIKVIAPIMVNLRETINYINKSTSRLEKFELIAQQVSAPALSLETDCPTRWNSTFDMLETAIKFREAFVRLKECDSSYKFCPSDEDWIHVAKVTDCLRVFYEATLRASGSKFPTASLYFNDFCGIYIFLQEWKLSNDAFIAAMAVPIAEKFEKYWETCNKLLSIATILDPRYKLKSIEYYYGLLYPFEKEVKVERIRKCFSDLFDEYSKQPTQSSSVVGTSRNFQESSLQPSSVSLFSTRLGLEKFIQESNSNQQKRSEFDVYLDDPPHPGISDTDFDILNWWKLHGTKYPIISQMACDILSVPMSTVASESCFSLAKQTLDDKRCSLLPQTLEAVICTHDWLRGYIPGDFVEQMTAGSVSCTQEVPAVHQLE